MGGTTVLSAVTAPATAAVTVTYSSSKEDVARVNANTGVVTAIGAGEAVITATATEDVYKRQEFLHPAFRIRGALRQIRVRQEHLAAASEKESNAIRKTGGAHSVLR